MSKNRVRLKFNTWILNDVIQLTLVIILIFAICESEAKYHSYSNHIKRHHHLEDKQTLLELKNESHHETNHQNEFNEYALLDDRKVSIFKDLRHRKHRPHRSHNLIYQDKYDYNGYHHSHDDSFKRESKRTASSSASLDSNISANQLNDSSSTSSVQRDYMAAVVGKDVQLDCRMKNLANDDDKIVWLKMPKGEVLTLNSNRVTSDSRVSTKCIANSVPCWSLIITTTRETDTGFYVCQTNAMQTKYVYLDIMVPPKLLTQYPVDRIDVNQSTNATITCEFYGKPDPLVKWYKYNNGVQKEIEKFRGSKTISVYIHKDSASEYECVADNSIPPTVSKKIYLNIQYPPQIKFLNSKVFQKKGERVIFDCNVNSNPLSKIYWYKNQTRIYESHKFNFENLDDSYHRLYINNLTDGDFGDYFCTATNQLGKSTSKIQLIELRPTIEHKKPTTKPTAISTTVLSSSSSAVTFDSETSKSTTTTSLDSNTLTETSTNVVETNQNETVIRISLNRDNKIEDYDPMLDDKKSETSLTKVKNPVPVAKLPSYRSNKHHLQNRTKIYKNHRKQIQKPYMNTPLKNHHSMSSTNSNLVENSGIKTAKDKIIYIYCIFMAIFLIHIE